MRSRGQRSKPYRPRWIELSRADGGFHLWKTGSVAQLPTFDEFTFSLWVRPQTGSASDGTIVQWVWQEDLPSLTYWQIFRLRWFQTNARVSMEIFDPTTYAYVLASNNRPFSVPRGRLTHLHGYWHKSTGFVGRQMGEIETTYTGATTPNDIVGSYADWHAVCGGQDLGTGLLNQFRGDLGPIWVGFNQNRPYTDFYDPTTKRPTVIPDNGDVGGGQPEFYFNGNHQQFNSLRGGGSVNTGYATKYPSASNMQQVYP